MIKLSEHLFNPNQNIFKGVMTIDSYGLYFLMNVFIDAHKRTTLRNEELVDLEADWVKRLIQQTRFSIGDQTGHYELDTNTHQIIFHYRNSEELIAESEQIPEWFIETFGKENIQDAAHISIELLIKFLMNYNFNEYFKDECDFDTNIDKVTSFCIRDYCYEKEIIIPLSDFIEKQ